MEFTDCGEINNLEDAECMMGEENDTISILKKRHSDINKQKNEQSKETLENNLEDVEYVVEEENDTISLLKRRHNDINNQKNKQNKENLGIMLKDLLVEKPPPEIRENCDSVRVDKNIYEDTDYDPYLLTDCSIEEVENIKEVKRAIFIQHVDNITININNYS